jgi:hypothetical protein
MFSAYSARGFADFAVVEVRDRLVTAATATHSSRANDAGRLRAAAHSTSSRLSFSVVA